MNLNVIRRSALAATLTATLVIGGTTVAGAAERPGTGAIVTSRAQAPVAAPVITSQPKSVAMIANRTATMSVAVRGALPRYQWQVLAPGTAAWRDVAGATAGTYKISTRTSHNGFRVRAVIHNDGGQVSSAAATLTVITTPKVTAQPTAKRAWTGSKVSFAVKASGYGVTYRWQQLLLGQRWTYITGANKSALVVLASSARNGSSYRAVVSNAAGQAISASAKLTAVTRPVAAPKITSQPRSTRATAGKTAVFTVKASGTGLVYRWQKLVGKTWTTVPGAVHSTLGVAATSSRNGTQYRAIIRNAGGQIVSAVVTLAVQSTRSDPYRVGVSATLKSWRVNLAGSNTNAWADIKADGFGPGPDAGNRYVDGRFSLRYLGAGSSTPFWDLAVEFVGSNGRTYTDTEKFYWTNSIFGLNEMYHNATGSFFSTVEVPASAADGGRWKVTDYSDWSSPVVVWYAAK